MSPLMYSKKKAEFERKSVTDFLLYFFSSLKKKGNKLENLSCLEIESQRRTEIKKATNEVLHWTFQSYVSGKNKRRQTQRRQQKKKEIEFQQNYYNNNNERQYTNRTLNGNKGEKKKKRDKRGVLCVFFVGFFSYF